jgi:hypothetical protein
VRPQYTQNLTTMIDREFRNVLLIKAIEETDSRGEVIPLADRATASREALREIGAQTPSGQIPSLPTSHAERLVAARTERLLQPLLTRHPFLQHFLALLEGPSWIGILLLVICLALGGAMSAIDGDNRIDILGFPLLLLVMWNFAIYTLLLVHALRGAAGPGRAGSAAALYDRWVAAGVRRLLSQSSRFDAPLTAALQRFSVEWARIARPALMARGARLFHVCSACVATGLVVALYFRGIWRGYRAGWDSTWPDLVPPLLRAFYGPAAWITHIALPTAGRLESIRWSAGSGEPAAPWIHLMAVTAILFIIAPRLALAAWYSIRAWSLQRSLSVPANLQAYQRTVLWNAGLPQGRSIVSVIPYGYEPSPDAVAALNALLPALFGEGVAVDARACVRFGEEDEFLAALPARQDVTADCLTVLVNLASTPEDENHGSILVGLRDWLTRSQAKTQLLVLIDEGPYAARMATAAERLSERRVLWRKFLQDRGIRSALVDLRAGHRNDELDAATMLRVREALQAPGLASP